MYEFEKELEKIKEKIDTFKKEVDWISTVIDRYPVTISLGIGIHKYETDGNIHYTYVKFEDIPKKYKDTFDKWMRGQTYGIIDGIPVAYVWDLERWLKLTLHNVSTY